MNHNSLRCGVVVRATVGHFLFYFLDHPPPPTVQEIYKPRGGPIRTALLLVQFMVGLVYVHHCAKRPSAKQHRLQAHKQGISTLNRAMRQRFKIRLDSSLRHPPPATPQSPRKKASCKFVLETHFLAPSQQQTADLQRTPYFQAPKHRLFWYATSTDDVSGSATFTWCSTACRCSLVSPEYPLRHPNMSPKKDV